MKKYIIAYIIGFSLLIGSVVNIAFELADFELHVTPSSSDLTIETVLYDISDLVDEDGFTTYYDHEIDEEIEDNKVEITVAGVGDVKFVINESHRSYTIDGNRKYIPSFYISGSSINIADFFNSLIDQIEKKKIYTHDYQYFNFEVTIKMNSKTAEKYVD